MPRWGRPPGVWQGNQARRRAGQWEEFNGARVEEIDTDGDDGYNGVRFGDEPRRNGRVGSKMSARELRLRNNGYDYESELSDGAEFDLDDDADSTVAYAVQLAMRDKEEMLVEKALERIRRAQMLGKKNVKLSQEELDALERRRKGITNNKKGMVAVPIGSPGRATANDRRPKSRESVSRTSPRTSGASESRRSSQGQYPPTEFSGVPLRPPNGIYTSMSNSPTSSSSRPRTPTMQSLRPQPSANSPMHQTTYMQRYPSEREPPFARALPDDPQWVPRQRSQSNVLPYPPYDNFGYLHQQYGPMPVDPRYASLPSRRPVPQDSASYANYASATTSQNSSRREAVNPSSRRIPDEISEDDSSDDLDSEEDEEDDDDDDDDDDDNGDEGVQVTQPPAVRAYGGRTAVAGSGPGGNRETRRRRGR